MVVWPSTAEFFAGGEIPAPKEALAAGLYGGLLALGNPGGHILGLTQPGTAAKSTMGIASVLGAIQPGAFEWFLHGEMLALVVWGY